MERSKFRAFFFSVFAGGSALFLFEGLYKVADILKATEYTDIGYFLIRGSQ